MSARRRKACERTRSIAFPNCRACGRPLTSEELVDLTGRRIGSRLCFGCDARADAINDTLRTGSYLRDAEFCWVGARG